MITTMTKNPTAAIVLAPLMWSYMIKFQLSLVRRMNIVMTASAKVSKLTRGATPYSLKIVRSRACSMLLVRGHSLLNASNALVESDSKSKELHPQ